MTAGIEALRARVGRSESRAETVRRVAIVVLLALGAAAIGVAAWSLVNGGIGWDARFDTFAALEVRSIHAGTLAEAYDAAPLNSEFYGVFLQQFADVLHVLTTGSTEPLGPDDSTTYLYQGAATLILSAAAVTALAFAVGVAFRSLLAGAFAWSLTLATPLWLGMSHVDFKDLPVAAGVTLVTAGLVLAFALERPRRAALAGALVAGAGGAITLSTRAGSLALLVALAGATAAVVLGRAIVRRAPREALPVAIAACSVVACALAFTWATNPIARIGMVQWLKDSGEIARNYPWEGPPIRTAGHDVLSTDLPWWYVPAWLAAQLPLLSLAAVLGGLVTLVVVAVRRRRSIGAATAVPLVPIALQGIVLPVGIVLSGVALYDGIRHLLFMLPGLIALTAVALALLDRGAGSRLRTALPLTAVVVVAASLAASIRWAPYAYAFVNPVAGWNKDGRSWELDYWGVSAREGIRRLRDAGMTTIYVSPTSEVGIPYGATDQRVSTDGLPGRGDQAGLYVFLRWDRAADYACIVVFTIKRDGLTLGEGARCF